MNILLDDTIEEQALRIGRDFEKFREKNVEEFGGSMPTLGRKEVETTRQTTVPSLFDLH